MEIAISLLFTAVGIINFIPVVGVISSAKVSGLYDVQLPDGNSAILLRHRALLFGILGGVIIFSAFCKTYQPLALVMGFCSMIGYAALCIQQGDYNQKLKRVLAADWLALALFTLALILRVVAGF